MTQYYFSPFPLTYYDIKKNGRNEILTNITVRFKIQEQLKNSIVPYYDYSIQEHERPDIVAFKFYEDPKLDWLIMLVNNIIDPHYDWPLHYREFEAYIKKKYGSIPTAQGTVHEYRKILNTQNVLFDGTIVPKRTLVIDEETYDTLATTEKESISKYDWEVEKNDEKRQIKVVAPAFVSSIVSATKSIFNAR